MGRKFHKSKKRPENTNCGKPGNYWLDEISKHNDSLFSYYKQQGIIDEEEWEAFQTVLKEDLPSAFRIRRSLPEREQLDKLLNEKFIGPLKADETTAQYAPSRLPFIPFAYQSSASRAAMRSSPLLKSLHEFLVIETEIGNVSRQEAVSMVPPMLLDVKPHHIILDACASPGSKTSQIIEMMHENESNPEGLLVANDINGDRCYLLVHQTLKRLPTANVVVVNQDAATMPSIVDQQGKVVYYDRILCDVICSGDGTFRKNYELWKSWDVQKGLNLHKVQQNIARRCLDLLKVGGRMVYSTCSLNPIEDEAVVAHMLRGYKDAVQLVDVSHELPDLKRSHGRSSWKVFGTKMQQYQTYDEAFKANDRAIVPSMFPPTAEEEERFQLDRTFRILPHAQNSGGFFVAVFEKVDETPPPQHIGQHEIKHTTAKKRKMVREDPFIFLDSAVNDLKMSLAEHYGIPEVFPYDNLLIRTANVEKKKGIYLVNDNLRSFLRNNGDRFHVINAGVSVMKRVLKISPCDYRLAQDGLPYISPFLTKRVIDLNSDDVAKVLSGAHDEHYVPMNELKEHHKFANIPAGTVVLKVKLNGLEKEICAWMGAQTVTAFVTREEKIHLLTLMDRDTTALRELAKASRQKKPDQGRWQQDVEKEKNSEAEGPKDNTDGEETKGVESLPLLE